MKRICMVLGLAFVLMGLNAQAVAPKSVKLDISAQPLVDALNDLAHQAGLQLLLDADVSSQSATAPSLKGDFTPEVALQHLLAKTNLRYEFLDARTVAVRMARAREVRPVSGQLTPASADGSRGLFRLARAAADSPAAAEQAVVDADKQQSDANEGRGIPEILVRDRRTSNVDIRRSEDDVQPYVVFNAEDIEQSMAGNLEDFLRTRLPMNTQEYTDSQIALNAESNYDGNRIDLRGMGADQTLILVNGRRIPGSFNTAEFQQPSINGIPLSSVERIEVLPSTAGGIYGGGATGGVINIILKRDYRGLELNARYDNVFGSDAARRTLNANAGFSLEGGRTNVMISASYSDSNPFTQGETGLTERGRQLQLLNNPAAILNASSPPIGGTTNIRSTNGQDLVLKSTGQSLGSPITHVPGGYAGPASDGGQAFLTTAGQYNLELPSGLAGKGQTLLASPTTLSASINVRRNFTDRIEAFVDVTSSSSENSRLNAVFFGNYSLLATHAGNPFEQNIRIQFAGSDFYHGGAAVTTNESIASNIGLNIRLPYEWTVQGEYGWGLSSFQSAGSRFAFTDRDFPPGPALLGIWDGTLDVLRDENTYPHDYTPYLIPSIPGVKFLDPSRVKQITTALRLAGPTVNLPGGPVVLSALLERRTQETLPYIIQTTQFYAPYDASYRSVAPRGERNLSGYIEATIPLFSAANALPGLRALDIQASYRRDERTTRALAESAFSFQTSPSPDGPFTNGDTEYLESEVVANQYTFGIRYQPVESVALRASYGEGVLPPSLSQLVPRLVYDLDYGNFSRILDHKRGNEQVILLNSRQQQGNPDLLPESSRSVSAGAVFTPAILPGLRLSIDYTRIEKSDEISFGNVITLAELEEFFPGRIVRAPLTPEDQALGFTGGVITDLNDSQINISQTKVEAVDIQADYDWNTAYGMFRAYVIGTHMLHREYRAVADSALIDPVGYANGPLEWRGNGGLNWQRGVWSAGWNAQWYNSYKSYNFSPLDQPGYEAYIAGVVLNYGRARIPRQIYHDMFVKYRVEESALAGGMLANSEIMLGISNVFDTLPPALPTTNTLGGYSRYGDPRLRRYSISFRKSF